MTTEVWHVGDVKITRIVELGSNVRTPDFVFRNLSREEVKEQTWLQPHFATTDGRLISSNHAFVIESGTRRIIVDTCLGNDKMRKNALWNQRQGSFLQDLETAGYPAGSIDTVLCTHLHVDHVGWNTKLVDGNWIPTFPNAQYLFGRTEWNHWSNENSDQLDGDVTPHIADNILEARACYDDSVRPIVEAGLHRLVESDEAITDEISLFPTPGHTPGHVSVRVASQGEQAIITGDMMHHPIQCAMPQVTSNFDHDIARALATRADFLRQHANTPVLILGTHFSAPTAGWIVPHEETWRFRVYEPQQAKQAAAAS
jgi:glyoxylase-like metal-dependent hydrolase (beta-lactamase superfamily II)